MLIIVCLVPNTLLYNHGYNLCLINICGKKEKDRKNEVPLLKSPLETSEILIP